MCGGNHIVAYGCHGSPGLSPRVRGKLLFWLCWICWVGSIPACAGETFQRAAPWPASAVYPRVCGGNKSRPRATGGGRGLSPRVRGKPRHHRVDIRILRSIPACAGETENLAGRLDAEGVYPRVCGGNAALPGLPLPLGGLSPRVRGKPSCRRGRTDSTRSIPACAGETTLITPSPSSTRVYPRVCGGNVQSYVVTSRPTGLSPRVRGKPAQEHRKTLPRWSIPACAGETLRQNVEHRVTQVYPRVCGGNNLTSPIVSFPPGLSPRVRGKPA